MMLSSTSILLAYAATAASAGANLQPRACGDNCARAVSATRFGQATLAARIFECNNHLRATVLRSASVVTLTETAYATVTSGYSYDPSAAPAVTQRDVLHERRTDRPVPAYATPCANLEAYKSACLCAGATAATVTEDPPASTVTVTSTETVTLQGDSPPYSGSASGSAAPPPTGTAWTATHSYYEVDLPTSFPTATESITFPAASPSLECLIDPTNAGAEFYLLDQHVGYLFNVNNAPGHAPAPKSEAEAAAITKDTPFDPPLFKFEKPSNAPDGLFDLVMVSGSTKQYIGMRGTAGEVIFTPTSTNGATSGRISTTIFSVTCKGYLVVRQGSTTYSWKAVDDATKLTAGGSNEDTIVLLPKAGRSAASSSSTTATRQRRSYATVGKAPRCPNAPAVVIATLKKGAREPMWNGCGPQNGVDWIPDWNFGRCCDDHDRCFDNCAETFEGCNNVFHGCMRGKCEEVWHSWLFWLYHACKGMADFYAYVVSTDQGVNAFNPANTDRCECTCPNTGPVAQRPNGLAQSLCQVDNRPQCIITGGNDNNNCGGCNWNCPYKTHCSFGGCVCDEDRCGNQCLSFRTHPRNCGGCGKACASGLCWEGSCWTPPAVIDRCYPVEGFTNPMFTDGFTFMNIGGNGHVRPWEISVQWGNVGFDYGLAAGAVFFNGDGSDHWNKIGQATISQNVKVCAGTAYELDFSYSRFSNGLCTIDRVQIGSRVLASNLAIPAGSIFDGAPSQGSGPYRVAPFTEGLDGATAGANFSLSVPFSIQISCSLGHIIPGGFSLHIES